MKLSKKDRKLLANEIQQGLMAESRTGKARRRLEPQNGNSDTFRWFAFWTRRVPAFRTIQPIVVAKAANASK